MPSCEIFKCVEFRIKSFGVRQSQSSLGILRAKELCYPVLSEILELIGKSVFLLNIHAAAQPNIIILVIWYLTKLNMGMILRNAFIWSEFCPVAGNGFCD